MRRFLAVISVLVAGTVDAAPPVVEFSDVHKELADLVMSWPAAPPPVDGYRVYRSEDPGCAPSVMVYEGAATTFRDVGALSLPVASIYRMVAYLGVEESAPSEPAYKFPVALSSDGSAGHFVPWPALHGISDSIDMCTQLNGAPMTPTPVLKVALWREELAVAHSQSCAGLGPTWTFPAVRPQPILTKPNLPGTSIMVWGRGLDGWRTDLASVRGTLPVCDPLTQWCMTNLYAVSLPWDHDYADLAEIAADIPSAVEVRLYDRLATSAATMYGGLTRPDSSASWSGTNAALARPAAGIFVAVDMPTVWYPRRMCTGPVRMPARIRDLRITRLGSDALLSWTPDALALGGYSMWRVASGPEIPAVRGRAADRSIAEVTPAFPVVDQGAMGLAGIHFYQVAGIDGLGNLGPL